MRANGKHLDAAWHIGNLLMGQAALDGPVEDNTGSRYLRADFAAAGQFYMQGSQLGNPLAMHRVAHMLARGFGFPRSCPSAAATFKQLAEMGTAAANLNYAHLLLEAGAPDRALTVFAYVASLGVESAQYNTAYLLTRRHCPGPFQIYSNRLLGPYSIELPYDLNNIHKSTIHVSNDDSGFDAETASANVSTVGHQEECELRALYLFMVSARQGNAEAFLRIGDSYYYGLAGAPPNKFKAATYYKLAADLHHTHAIFNLGMMHEAGDGVEQDFHLAKRFFDRAALYDTDALLPRTVALTMLESHKFLHQRFGAEVADIVVETSTAAWQALAVAVSSLRFYIEGISPPIRSRDAIKPSRNPATGIDVGGTASNSNKELQEFLAMLGPFKGVLSVLVNVFLGWEAFLADLVTDIRQLFVGSDSVEDNSADGLQYMHIAVALTPRSWQVIINTALLTLCCAVWMLINAYRNRRLRERAQR